MWRGVREQTEENRGNQKGHEEGTHMLKRMTAIVSDIAVCVCLLSVSTPAFVQAANENATVTESSSGQAWIYQDKSVLVAFGKETGEVWASIDVRLQPHITFLNNETTFRYKCQLEELNREQLRWVGTAASGWQTEWNVDISDIELPLDVQKAYEIGERTVYEFCRHQPATGGAVGGALYIYYCETSDVYFVVNRYFIQALPREEGEPLFLWGYGSWKDKSRRER